MSLPVERNTRAGRGQKFLLLLSLTALVFFTTGIGDYEDEEDCCLILIESADVLRGRELDWVRSDPESDTRKPGQDKNFLLSLRSNLAAVFAVKGDGIFFGSANVLEKSPVKTATLTVFLKPTNQLPESFRDRVFFSVAGREFNRRTWKSHPLGQLLASGAKVSLAVSLWERDSGVVVLEVSATRDDDPKWTDPRKLEVNLNVDARQLMKDLGII